MSDTQDNRSFVARFWLESPDDNAVWRGHLRHVQGDEECYFQSLSVMKEFLGRISGVPFSMSGEVVDREN
ncbi:MAG: hypothetical protein GY742_01865 [Hyphomicrobiales bacterium]|nr:hypothetical protein [Hyphomicrobiales bacterium]